MTLHTATDISLYCTVTKLDMERKGFIMKKLAIIGCGGIGSYHLSHFVKYDDIELAGFCDLILERAEKFVEIAKSGKAYTDFTKMYDEVKPDMVRRSAVESRSSSKSR